MELKITGRLWLQRLACSFVPPIRARERHAGNPYAQLQLIHYHSPITLGFGLDAGQKVARGAL
jgi:hypothetical protein